MRHMKTGGHTDRLRGETGQAGVWEVAALAGFVGLVMVISQMSGEDKGSREERAKHCPAPTEGYGLEDQGTHTYDDPSTEGIDLKVMNDGKRLRFMGPAVKSEVLVAGLGEDQTQYSFDTDTRFPNVFVQTSPVDFTHVSKALNVSASNSNC